MSASSAKKASGIFTPDSDTLSIEIDIGFVPNGFYIYTLGELVSGKRNFRALEYVNTGASLLEIGLGSNATGSNWAGSSSILNETSSTRILTIDGTRVKINNSIIQSSYFISGVNYQWAAIG